ncbi:hypothetical protein FYJ43_05760 [Cutibacterium sp. WCA-380-WT-3A]|uniref:Uncharacterized protein n=1 Tax=Cutibacterium porci TaxID=2605781 RepID=A0A7K0J6G2_9ACTN|nr:hypothetical protein [Cutibacterium porci]MSS45556.1 hypothetical protein [Cutibacterium porci]
MPAAGAGVVVVGAGPAACGADEGRVVLADGEAIHQGVSLTPGTAPPVWEHPASNDSPAAVTAIIARRVILM